jgi:hypothetical protein
MKSRNSNTSGVENRVVMSLWDREQRSIAPEAQRAESDSAGWVESKYDVIVPGRRRE